MLYSKRKPIQSAKVTHSRAGVRIKYEAWEHTAFPKSLNKTAFQANGGLVQGRSWTVIAR